MYVDFYQEAAKNQSITLDDFQVQACLALEEGRDVLLCAPTGAGKTMVAHFAVELAFATSSRCVYTTPIKALSNQKYRELASRYGSEHIGLMTGDVTINRDAPIVVMTTEVLRNLIYAGAGLDDLGYVVLDEVHYLADPERGPTWEEVILELDRSVRIFSLSATIANAGEFHDWLESVRGDTELVVTTLRPVPLLQHVMVGKRLHKLYDGGPSTTLGQGKNANPKAIKAWHSGADKRVGPAVRKRVLDVLSEASMLPAIHFIFSRKGCDQAVMDLRRAGVSLTTKAERKAIHQSLDEIRSDLSEDDKAALRFRSFEQALANGYAAHHAGVYPPLKEVIERLMQRGLIKLVYATGTLALGINMPVRTTVIESLEKFNGTDFSPLSGIEYTQLIGRAGRRGKDDVGHAVILAGDGDIETLLSLGSGELEPLRSAFFPSYNTVVNTLAVRDYPAARAVLARSFAQFQKNRDLAELEITAERIRQALEDEEARLADACEAGSVIEYAQLRHRAGRASSQKRKKAKRAYRNKILDSFDQVQIGDLIAYSDGTSLEYGYVAQLKNERVRVATWMGDLVWITPEKVRSELRVIGQYSLPTGMKLREAGTRDILAAHLCDEVEERVEIGLDEDLLQSWNRHAVAENPQVLAHPVHSCPEREQHLEDATAYMSLQARMAQVTSTREQFDDSVGSEFDATAGLLAHLGILSGRPGAYTIGAGARPLRRIHSTADLLIYECLKDPLWAEMNEAELAGMLSVFTFKIGRGRARPPINPLAWRSIVKNHEFISDLERRFGLDRQPELSSNPTAAVAAWAAGESLERCLGMANMLPGDFITGLRRTVDLLTQVEFAMEGHPIEHTARAARFAISRPGVVDTLMVNRATDSRESDT